MSDIDKVSKSLSDLIIADTFNKHGVTPDRTKGLTAEQKQELKDLVEDLKKQVDQFLKVQTDEKQQSPAAATNTDRLPDPPQRKAAPAPAPNLSSAVAPKSRRRRLGFKKNK